MPGLYILLAFQYWLKKNADPFKWTTASKSPITVTLKIKWRRKMVKIIWLGFQKEPKETLSGGYELVTGLNLKTSANKFSKK